MSTLSPGASSTTWLQLSQPRTSTRTEAGRSIPESYNPRMGKLDGLRVVTTALNLPGPAACARLRDMGAAVAKVEPPAGDPMEQFNAVWYRKLHQGMSVGRLDLKSEEGRRAMAKLLDGADLLVT